MAVEHLERLQRERERVREPVNVKIHELSLSISCSNNDKFDDFFFHMEIKRGKEISRMEFDHILVLLKLISSSFSSSSFRPVASLFLSL